MEALYTDLDRKRERSCGMDRLAKSNKKSVDLKNQK